MRHVESRERPSQPWLNGPSANAALWATVIVLSSVFLLHLLSLLSHGVDLPIDDDWRELKFQTTGSFALKHLFLPVNDTIAPVGRFIDALGVFMFSGNNVVMQGFTFVAIIGTIAALQISLLRKYAGTTVSLLFAVMAMMLMLQAGTYWGVQTLAYHQALPVLCMLAALALIVAGDRARPGLHATMIFAVCLVGGLSYLSGAIAVLAASVWTALVMIILPEERRRLSSALVGLCAAALVTIPAQVGYGIIYAQKGAVSVAGTPMALPTDSSYWAFFLGMVGRSVGFNHSANSWRIMIAVLLVCAAVAAFVMIALRAWRDRDQSPQLQPFGLYYVFGYICAFVLGYALVVSAGRANVRPPEIATFPAMFAHAQLRFHFFWLTILWPWLAIVVGNFAFPRATKRSLIAALAILAFAVVAPVFRTNSVYDFDEFYANASGRKAKALACLNEKVATGQRIVCPDILAGDVTEAVAFAKTLDLTFVRGLPFARHSSRMIPTPALGQPGVNIPFSFPSQAGAADVPISRIGVMLGTHQRVNPGTAKVEFSDGRSATSVTFDLSQLEDNKYRVFDVQPAPYTSGQLVAGTGAGVSVWEAHVDHQRPVSCLLIEYVNGASRTTPGCPEVASRRGSTLRAVIALAMSVLLAWAVSRFAPVPWRRQQ